MSESSWGPRPFPGELPARIPFQHLPAVAVIDWHDYNGEPIARQHTRLGHPHIVIPTIAEYLMTCRESEADPDPIDFMTFAEILAVSLDDAGTNRQNLASGTTYYYRLVKSCDFTTQPADPFRWQEPQRGLQLIAQRHTDGFHRSGSGAPTPWRTVLTTSTLSTLLTAAANQLRRLAQVRPSIEADTDGALLNRADLIVQATCFTELARTLGPYPW